MTDNEAIEMHRALAAYHAELAREAMLDIVHEHHADLAERLANEATVLIPSRRAAAEKFAARAAACAAAEDREEANASIIGLGPMP